MSKIDNMAYIWVARQLGMVLTSIIVYRVISKHSFLLSLLKLQYQVPCFTKNYRSRLPLKQRRGAASSRDNNYQTRLLRPTASQPITLV